jgi:hypothetical protein
MIPFIHAELSAKRFGGIPEEFMHDLFGDHARVTIFRNGSVETEACENHD